MEKMDDEDCEENVLEVIVLTTLRKHSILRGDDAGSKSLEKDDEIMSQIGSLSNDRETVGITKDASFTNGTRGNLRSLTNSGTGIRGETCPSFL